MNRFPFLALVLAVVTTGCPQEAVSSAETLGKFAFSATPLSSDCALFDGPDGGFTFTATLTVDPAQGPWLVLNGVGRAAQFDGQRFESRQSAPRHFGECTCAEPMEVDETFRAVLLSASQSARTGGTCPAHPLDGGVPAPDPDGGITGPGPTERGFDALRACGELIERYQAPADCGSDCRSCTAVLRLEGVRQ